MLARLLSALATVLVVLAGPGAAHAVAVDSSTVVVGQVQRWVVETIDGSDADFTAIAPPGAPAIRVDAAALADVPTGDWASVELGAISAGNQDVTTADGGADVLVVAPVDQPAQAAIAADAMIAASAPIGSLHRSAAVLTATLPGQTSDGITVPTLASDLNGAVSSYWSDSTGGLVTFTAGNQVAAGVYSSWGDLSTCTTAQVLGFLSWTATQGGVAPTVNTGRHSITYTPTFGSCGFAGVANLSDGGSAWVNGLQVTSARVGTMEHELGHTLGLGHSNTRVGCPSGSDGSAAQCTDFEYGDAYDVMGVALNGDGPLSGAQLDVLGLLTPASTVDVTGGADVTLAPVGGLTGSRFLRFVTGGATYVVEYRGAVGRDANLATSRRGCPTGLTPCSYARFVPGVVVHRLDSTTAQGKPVLLQVAPGPTFALQPLSSFTTADGAYSITVDSTSAQGARVIVNGGVQATSSPDSSFQSISPVRILPRTRVGPQSTVTVTVPNVPAGATAVALNITAADVRATSYVSACAAGTPITVCRRTSALNPSAGTDTASAAIVALGGTSGDQVTLYNNAGTLSLIVDLAGYYVAGASAGSLFVNQAPQRALDTRVGTASTTSLTLPGVPAGATAVLVTVTSSAASAVTFVSACPSGEALAACSTTSAINPTPSRDLANVAVVKLGGPAGNEIMLYNNAGSVRLVVDVSGYFVDHAVAPASAALFRATAPVRVLAGQRMLRAQALTFTPPGQPTGTVAVQMNVTSTATTGVSFVSACPGGTAVDICRLTSILNPAGGIDSSDNATVTLGGPGSDSVLLYNNAAPLTLIVDVTGYFVRVA